MTDYEDLKRAIRKDRSDTTPILIAADWLEEHDKAPTAHRIRALVEGRAVMDASCVALGDQMFLRFYGGPKHGTQMVVENSKSELIFPQVEEPYGLYQLMPPSFYAPPPEYTYHHYRRQCMLLATGHIMHVFVYDRYGAHDIIPSVGGDPLALLYSSVVWPSS